MDEMTTQCRFLRWKGLYIGAEPDPEVPREDGTPCWCVHTMNCLGPDGQVAKHDRCLPGRTCFESAVRVV